MAELRRVLGTRDLVIYYVSSLVGAGILVVPGVAQQVAGPAALVGWLLLSAAAFPIAAMFARVSAHYPNAAGVGYLVRRAFGWRLGMSVGLLLLFLNTATNPILGLAAARYVAALFGWQNQTVILLTGLGVMLLGVAMNLLGVKLASRAQFLLVVVLILGLLTVVAVAAPAADADRLTPFAPHGWTAIGAALVVCFFSFFGWENVSHYADEVRDPVRSYPAAARWGALCVAALYCAIALTVALVVPAGRESAAVLDAVLASSHGQSAARFGSALAVVLLVVTTNAWVLGASRLLYAMSRDRVISPRFSRVSPRNGAPTAALLALAVWYVCDIAFLLLIGRDERFLIAFTAASILVIYIATFLAGFRLFTDRRTRVLCGVALLAVTAFLAVGGIPSLLAVLAFGISFGYLSLRHRREPTPEAEPEPEAAAQPAPSLST
jgi:amino acid efflux transporter